MSGFVQEFGLGMCFVFKLELYPWEIGGGESLSGCVSKQDYNSSQADTQNILYDPKTKFGII